MIFLQFLFIINIMAVLSPHQGQQRPAWYDDEPNMEQDAFEQAVQPVQIVGNN